ncbi:hypothetical protein B7P43_G00918 [Cryptotermes secundus]|uniref:Uncharacterized protein n=1 Tax=Cryptotermes secundus TaxID=105785 RepID=A0A2J7RT07_9NEOP|nr:hypothetical protein B7P43_G00918 [Cryptotermes secundus]
MIFYCELLAPRPTLKLEGHPLSAVRDCLFNIFAASLHGHVARMGEMRNAYRILVGKPEGRRSQGDEGVGRWTILEWILER